MILQHVETWLANVSQMAHGDEAEIALTLADINKPIINKVGERCLATNRSLHK